MINEIKRNAIRKKLGKYRYKKRETALKKAKKLRQKYELPIYPIRETKEKFKSKKNIIKKIYEETFILDINI